MKKGFSVLIVLAVILLSVIIISKIIFINAASVQGACVKQAVTCNGPGTEVIMVPCGESICNVCPPDSIAYQQECTGLSGNAQPGQESSNSQSNPENQPSGNPNKSPANNPSRAVPIVQNFYFAAFNLLLYRGYSSSPAATINYSDNFPTGELYDYYDGGWNYLSGAGIQIEMNPDKFPPPNPPNNITKLNVQYSYYPPYSPPLCNTAADCPPKTGGSTCIKSNFSIGACVPNNQISACSDSSGICILSPYQNAVLSLAKANDSTTMLQIFTATRAQCKYSTNADTSFTNSQLFLEDNALSTSIQHSIPLNNIVKGSGIYSIYEKCIDYSGNPMSKVQTFVITNTGLSAKILGIRGLESDTFLISTNTTSGTEEVVIPQPLSLTTTTDNIPITGNQNLVLVIEKDGIPISTLPANANVSVTTQETSSPSLGTGTIGIIFIVGFLWIVIILIIRKRILDSRKQRDRKSK